LQNLSASVLKYLMFIAGEELPQGISSAGEDAVVKYYCSNQSTQWEERPSEVDQKDKDTPDNWIKRHPQLVRLTGRHPFNCEAPFDVLMSKGFITPTSLHYVRTHGSTPKIDWLNHKIHLGGLVPSPCILTMSDILKLPRVSFPVTLVCCGNRRKEQNLIKQTIGFNWGAAGVSTG